MEDLTRLVLRDPGERPELAAGRPEVWRCQSRDRPVRDVARALLRDILAACLGTLPDRVPLQLEPGRAPAVAASWQGMRLSISMSYAGDVALIGVCPGASIGVDLVEIVSLPDWAQVAQLYLGPDATQRLANMDRAVRDKAFAMAWAELEARSKCLGLGLQEWSPARQQRLYSPLIQIATFELSATRSGHAVAVALADTSKAGA